MRVQRLLLLTLMLGALCACSGKEELKPDPMPVSALSYADVSINGTSLSGLVATTYADRARAEAAIGLAKDEGEVACFVFGNTGEEEALNITPDLRRAGDLVYVNAAGKVVKVFDGDNGYLPPSVRNQSTRWSAIPFDYNSIEPASIGIFLRKGLAAELKLTVGSQATLGNDILAKVKEADPFGVKLFFQPASRDNKERESAPEPIKVKASVAATAAARARNLRKNDDALLLVWPDNDTSLASDGYWLKGVEGTVSIAFLRVQPASGWSTGESKPFMGFVVDVIEGVSDSGSNDLERACWWPSTERFDRKASDDVKAVQGPVNAVLVVRGEKAFSGRGIKEDMFVQATNYILPQNQRSQGDTDELAGTVIKIKDEAFLTKVLRADPAMDSRIVLPSAAMLASTSAALLVWDRPSGAHIFNPSPRKASVALLKQESGNRFTVERVVSLDGSQTNMLDMSSRYALFAASEVSVGTSVELPWEALDLRPTLRRGAFYSAKFAPRKHPSQAPEGSKKVYLEVADNEASIQRGLMHRTSLPENQGMIFIFGSADDHSFWMKNCKMDIDVAFVDADGEIRTIHEMKMPKAGTPDAELEMYASSSKGFSSGKVLYAVEMAGGWFAKNEVKVGDRLWLPKGQSKVASN